MAAVRCLMRRLGGSLLQRTQAAVAEEGRLLVPSRLMRSRELSSKVSGELQQTYAAVAKERRRCLQSRLMRSRQFSSEQARAHSTRQTHKKEEELYDMLSKANENHLPAQASEKRPFDPMRFKKYTERARGVLDLACKATFFVYGGAYLFGITGADRLLGFAEKVGEEKSED